MSFIDTVVLTSRLVTLSIERIRERKVKGIIEPATARYFYHAGQRFVNTRSFDGCLDLRYPCSRIVHKSWKWNRSNLSFWLFSTPIPCQCYNIVRNHRTWSLFILGHFIMCNKIYILLIIINILYNYDHSEYVARFFDITWLRTKQREYIYNFVWH